MPENQNVDINLSRNELLLQVTDFNRACHICVLLKTLFNYRYIVLIDSGIENIFFPHPPLPCRQKHKEV